MHRSRAGLRLVVGHVQVISLVSCADFSPIVLGLVTDIKLVMGIMGDTAASRMGGSD